MLVGGRCAKNATKRKILTVEDKRRDESERIAAVLALGKIDCPHCGAPYARGKYSRPYLICCQCGHRWSENPIVQAWGTFLEEVHQKYPWDWFGTFTFARQISPAGAGYWFRKYLEELGRAGIAKPYAFRADEYGPLNGRFHLHALVGNVSHLTIYCGERLPRNVWGRNCCWLHGWRCGYARIYPYDPAKGARSYLSKYVTKALANWDLFGFETENLTFADPRRTADFCSNTSAELNDGN